MAVVFRCAFWVVLISIWRRDSHGGREGSRQSAGPLTGDTRRSQCRGSSGVLSPDDQAEEEPSCFF
jgi:hypothetical protein